MNKRQRKKNFTTLKRKLTKSYMKTYPVFRKHKRSYRFTLMSYENPFILKSYGMLLGLERMYDESMEDFRKRCIDAIKGKK